MHIDKVKLIFNEYIHNLCIQGKILRYAIYFNLRRMSVI
jgi:hypothetical protein